MNKPNTLAAAFLGIAIAGCDRIPFLGGGDDAAADSTAVAAVDSAAAQPVAAAAQPAPVAARPVQQVTLIDEPWAPMQTGTVSPGMTRDDVLAAWGDPLVERLEGVWTYLYYRNGCEASCGTFDVVFLQNGQVVDAIVRGQGHDYDGLSSSPPGSEALPNVEVIEGTADPQS